MKKNYDVVIIGGTEAFGAVAGLRPRRGGLPSVAVLDKSYLGSGASGRNGEMIHSGVWIQGMDSPF